MIAPVVASTDSPALRIGFPDIVNVGDGNPSAETDAWTGTSLVNVPKAPDTAVGAACVGGSAPAVDGTTSAATEAKIAHTATDPRERPLRASTE